MDHKNETTKNCWTRLDQYYEKDDKFYETDNQFHKSVDNKKNAQLHSLEENQIHENGPGPYFWDETFFDYKKINSKLVNREIVSLDKRDKFIFNNCDMKDIKKENFSLEKLEGECGTGCHCYIKKKLVTYQIIIILLKQKIKKWKKV